MITPGIEPGSQRWEVSPLQLCQLNSQYTHVFTNQNANVFTNQNANVFTNQNANVFTNQDANVFTNQDANVFTNQDANVFQTKMPMCFRLRCQCVHKPRCQCVHKPRCQCVHKPRYKGACVYVHKPKNFWDCKLKFQRVLRPIYLVFQNEDSERLSESRRLLTGSVQVCSISKCLSIDWCWIRMFKLLEDYEMFCVC